MNENESGWQMARLTIAASLVVVAATQGLAQTSTPSSPSAGDLAVFLELVKYHVPAVEPERDPVTGFLVGGTNASSLIRKLTQLNGRTIAELESDMRPNAIADVASSDGFLGPTESLLEVLVKDNEYVVDQLRLTHQEIAKHLHAMGSIGMWQSQRGREGEEFIYSGRRFRVKLMVTRGYQLSPFMDGTKSGTNMVVENLDTGKKLQYGLLVPYMIERYGFYEGRGTPYRVEPSQVLEVLDFLPQRD